MTAPSPKHTPKSVAVVVTLWAAACIAWGWGTRGDDLSSLWMAGRLVLEGLPGHLYAYHPTNFAWVDDPVWLALREQLGVEAVLHPYLYPPIVAYLLSPFTLWLPFGVATRLVLVANVFALALTAVAAADLFHRPLLRPVPLALFLTAVALTTPFQYALALGQTTPLVLAAVLGGVWLERRGRPVAGGALLALAAVIKLTPALLLVWWLLRRRWRAVGGFALGVGLAGGLGLAAMGLDVHIEWITNLRRVSGAGLAAFNVQSVPAWLIASDLGPGAALTWEVFPLPAWVSLASAAVGAALTVGYLARGLRTRLRPDPAGGDLTADPAEGTVIAGLLLVPLLASNVSWTHYYLALMVPMIVLLRSPRSALGWVLLGAIWLLNVEPLAMEPMHPALTAVTFTRSHLLSGLLVAVALLVAPLPQDAE